MPSSNFKFKYTLCNGKIKNVMFYINQNSAVISRDRPCRSSCGGALATCLGKKQCFSSGKDTSHEESFPLVVSSVLLQALCAARTLSVLLWQLSLSSEESQAGDSLSLQSRAPELLQTDTFLQPGGLEMRSVGRTKIITKSSG